MGFSNKKTIIGRTLVLPLVLGLLLAASGGGSADKAAAACLETWSI